MSCADYFGVIPSKRMRFVYPRGDADHLVIALLTMIMMIVVASERLLAFLICYFSND